MRIDEKRPDIQTYGTGVEESFSVGNLGRILKILRNSMYAHPIKAICREITSNARDAHREIGTPDKPIEIHLPNEWDTHYKIKDFGTGISPERMSNIFLKYGNSTKNGDDVQTGGFGLGAKTPFAYSDQFQITTIVEEGNKRVQRTYIAYIDESEEGKMRLVTEVETDEETGTEISIYVSEADRHKFADATTEVCKFWDVKPVFSGRVSVEWDKEERKEFLSGDGWKMFRSEDSFNTFQRKSLAIVDGIMYPINPNNIDTNDRLYVSQLLNSGLYLYFKTGDVRLSANREELQYDDKTCPIILDRLEKISKEVSNLIVENVEKASTYPEAFAKHVEYKKLLSFAIKEGWCPEWKGNKVPFDLNLRFLTKCEQKNAKRDWYYTIERFAMLKSRRSWNETLRKESIDDIRIKQNGEVNILLNDLSDSIVSRKRVQHFIETNNIKSLYVITASHGNVNEALEKMKEDNHYNIDLNLFNPIRMSTIVLPKNNSKKKGGNGSGRSAYSAFLFDTSYSAYRNCDKGWRPTEIDTKKGSGFYVVISGRSTTVSYDKEAKKVVSNDYIKQAIDYFNKKDLNFKVHGIRQKDINRLGKNWVNLEEHIKKEVETILNKEKVTKKYVFSLFEEKKHMPTLSRYDEDVCDVIYKVSKKYGLLDGVAKSYYTRISEIEKDSRNLKEAYKLLSIIENYKSENKTNIEKIIEKCKETYPLLNFFGYKNPEISDIAEYIMLIDKKNREQSSLGLDKDQDNDKIVINQ